MENSDFFKADPAYGKCKTCLFRRRWMDYELEEPCSRCVHRPNRKQDKSEWLPEFKDKEEQKKHSEEVSGKYDF